MKTKLFSGRREIKWEKLRGARCWLATFVATAGGAGLFPVAPGTMGTLVGVPVAFFASSLPWTVRILFWLGITALGTWSARVFDETMQTSDNQNIVIDEVIGMAITAWTAGNDLKTWVVAFLLFRFFDVVKPPPVRQIDRWSKNQSATWRGFGVIADDMVAGFQGLGVILVLQFFQVF